MNRAKKKRLQLKSLMMVLQIKVQNNKWLNVYVQNNTWYILIDIVKQRKHKKSKSKPYGSVWNVFVTKRISNGDGCMVGWMNESLVWKRGKYLI